MLDHNLLLITQYHNASIGQTTAEKYATYLTHTQTKDKRFIHPPLKFTNLKTHIQECNPDKNILVNEPTIQTNASEADIYDQNGNHVVTLTIERIQWLWAQFSQNNPHHLTNFLQPPPQDFETEILWLIQRYITILPKKKPKIIQPRNLHQKLHPEITKTLINSFKITHSYYSSPLTCPIQLTQYHSPHNRDILFGSMGHANSSRWSGIGLAFPTDHHTTVEAIHWARIAAKEDARTITILIVNHKDWTIPQLPLTTNSDTHIMATIPPHTIQCDPTPEWPKYYQYTEPSITSIICIHNQTNIPMNIQTPIALQQVLQQTLNTHIDTFPIKPTPTHYNVKFSLAWKTAPKVSITQNKNTQITPLPHKFKHKHT